MGIEGKLQIVKGCDNARLTDIQTYNEHAAFVPALATKVIQLLDPQPEDVILDM